jgi:CheY-like chemotaxis protein
MNPRIDFSWDILLVEDNPADACLAQEALKLANIPHNLWVAENGVAALEYLQGKRDNTAAVRPDVILMDLNMPKMGGHELLAKIQSNDVLKSIPVFVLSSSNSADDFSRAYALNATYYINKPIDLDPFIDVIKDIHKLWLNVFQTT